jgi:hypothetical protein
MHTSADANTALAALASFEKLLPSEAAATLHRLIKRTAALFRRRGGARRRELRRRAIEVLGASKAKEWLDNRDWAGRLPLDTVENTDTSRTLRISVTRNSRASAYRA